MGTHPVMSWAVCLGQLLVLTLLEVIELEKGVVALHLPTGSLKTRSGLDPVPSYEPSTYQPVSR